ncbi:DNA internalization-related competence protein ComEC/Rec2 [Vibrio fortis]|uniref:DNA internalization-related competence protein ComEC/Rec2 n=1 Tax=Vibrio fortis TaxID=212667 RepID=UPI003EBE8D44
MFNTWFLLSFSLTLMSASLWPVMPHWNWAWVIVLVFIASTKYSVSQPFRGVLCGVIMVLIVSGLVKQQTTVLFKSGQDITINASVVSLFSENSRGYESVIVVRSINGDKLAKWQWVKTRLFTPFRVTQGEKIELSVRVKPILGKLNEAGFDLETYSFSQKIVAHASYLPGTRYRIQSTSSWRAIWFDQVTRNLNSLSNRDLIVALTFGYRDFISQQRWSELKSSGLIHLVAISGLHIGMAFGIGYQFGRSIRCLIPLMTWAPFASGLVIAFVYSWFSGFTLPTIRALVMCCLGSYFVWQGRSINSLNFILLSICIVLVIWPYSTLTGSFWLSFGSLAAVLYAVAMSSSEHSHTRFVGKLIMAVKVQCVLTLLLLPMTLYYYQGFSAVSVFYNLLMLPWVTFLVMPMLFLALLVHIFISENIKVIWEVIDALLEVISVSSAWSKPFWWELDMQVAQWVSLAVFISLFIYRYFKPWVSILLLVLVSIREVGPGNTTQEWQVDVLDVGHGLAVIIEKNERTLLYDLGNNWQGGSVVTSTLLPLLQQRANPAIDGVILSHLDSDHAGGLHDLIKLESGFWVRSSQGLSEQVQSTVHTCIAGDSWYWQGLKFNVLWPPKLTKRAYNPHSCVVRLFDPRSQFSMLLTGDIELVSEWMLSRKGSALKSDVMLVPHHGSKTSSSRRFIAAVSPMLAIASLAKGNRWGMPNREVVDRYQSINAKWLDTGESGQITIRVRAEGWNYHSIRQDRAQPWYRQMLRKGVE